MSNKLEKPYTRKQRAEFIIQNQGLKLHEDENALYMLKDNEEIKDGEIIDVSKTKAYKDKKKQKKQELQNSKKITRRQMILWLIDNKDIDRDEVLSFIGSISDPTIKKKAITSFLDATFFEFGNPFVSIIGVALGLTDEEIITMFDEACNL